MSRWGRPSRQGGRNHAAKGGGAVGYTPPQAAAISLWFDLTDITKLWQDADATIPVTTGGQFVRAVTNGGDYTVALSQPDLESRAPTWDATEGAVKFDGGDSLYGVVTEDGASGTACVLGQKRSVETNLTEINFNWNGFNKLGQWWTYAAGVPSTFRMYPYAGSGIDATTLPGHGDWVSFICQEDSNDSQIGWPSTDADPTDGGGNSVVINSTSDVIIGANSRTGGNGFTGWMKEVIVWDKLALTAGEVAELKAYDTAKHGTVWA